MQKANQTVWIIYTAFVFSSLIYLVVGFALLNAGWQTLVTEPNVHSVLFAVFAIICVVLVAIAFKIKPDPKGEKPLSGPITQFALCEVPSILGLVLFFLTGKFLYLVLLCAFSLLSFAYVRPRTPAD